MFEFVWPWVFALLPLPLLMLLARGRGDGKSEVIRAPFAERWHSLVAGESRAQLSQTWRTLPLWVIFLLLLAGAARPQWVGEPIQLPNDGRDLMLGIDLSGSMQIEDMQVGNNLVSRIAAVKAIAADFTSRRQGDRVGLILFGTRAYVQAPLTFDVKTVTRFIREAQLGFAGEDTAIGDALGLAIKRLRERPTDSRVLILLTDGQDTASTVDPMEAASLAAELDVRVYTIGISRNLGRLRGGGEVDEGLLRAVAEATGGRYFRARDPAELQSIYALLDELEPVEQEASTFRPRRSLSWLPLAGAALLAMLLLVARADWRFKAGVAND
jgi:Ca-activated chloride channel family protein